MVSKEGVICPHCKALNSKSKAVGTSGTVLLNGSSFFTTCVKCGKEFYGTYDVCITYRTRKQY